MHGFPKGGHLDRLHGTVLEPNSPIQGFQGSNLNVVRDPRAFMSGDAIFEREQLRPSMQSEVPSSLGRLSSMAVSALTQPFSGERASA
jgi:hypothetical protein